MTKPPRTIVFLGPDGAGKTTLIQLTEQLLAAKGVDFARYYFAPGYLKRYRPSPKTTITTNPHEGRQYGSALVFLKILLMLFEFSMGVPKVKRANKVVIFDRFIHDLLIDPRRYRLGGVRWWMRALLKLAPRADLGIIVTAPPSVIQARKQEVPPEETERQVLAYKDCARQFSRAVLIENVGPPEVWAARIVEAILGR